MTQIPSGHSGPTIGLPDFYCLREQLHFVIKNVKSGGLKFHPLSIISFKGIVRSKRGRIFPAKEERSLLQRKADLKKRAPFVLAGKFSPILPVLFLQRRENSKFYCMRRYKRLVKQQKTSALGNQITLSQKPGALLSSQETKLPSWMILLKP